MLAYCPHCNKEIEDHMTAIWFRNSQHMLFNCECPLCGQEIDVYVVPIFNVSKKNG